MTSTKQDENVTGNAKKKRKEYSKLYKILKLLIK